MEEIMLVCRLTEVTCFVISTIYLARYVRYKLRKGKK
jgi:hypothetical protein